MLLTSALLVLPHLSQPVLQALTQQLQAAPHSLPVELHALPALLVTLVLVALSIRLLAREPALLKLVHLARLPALHSRRVLPAATLSHLLR